MCGVLPCVAEVLNGCSRWQQSLFELLSADIPALVRSRQRQWWTGTVSVEHTGAFMQHLWETQWNLQESDLIMGKNIQSHLTTCKHRDKHKVKCPDLSRRASTPRGAGSLQTLSVWPQVFTGIWTWTRTVTKHLPSGTICITQRQMEIQLLTSPLKYIWINSCVFISLCTLNKVCLFRTDCSEC